MRRTGARSRRVVLAAAGVVAAFLALETGLRLAGALYKAYRLAGPAPDRPAAGGTAVLCVGDSFTFGVGAEKGMSYPEQLQRLLERNGPAGVRVINEGLPGRNSSAAVRCLDDAIERHRPDMVLLMIGRNDTTFFEGSDFYFFMPVGGRFAAADAFLLRSRAYAALRWSLISFADATAREFSRRRAGRPPSRGARPGRGEADVLRRVEGLESRPDEAHRTALDGLSAHPDSSSLHLRAGHLYFYLYRDPEKALPHLEKARALDPNNLEVRKLLARVHYRLGDLEAARREAEFLAGAEPSDADFSRLARFGYPAPLSLPQARLLKFNLTRILDICRKRKVMLVAMTYERDWSDNVIAEWAAENNVPLVDNTRLTASSRRPGAYVVPDGHYNSAGYGLLARNVHRQLAPILEARKGRRP